MFTGIVQGTARLAAIRSDQDLARLEIEFPPGSLDGVQKGASIALNGVCLTVTRFTERCAEFDVMAVTRQLTNLGELRPGARLNFERAMKATDEIGGHLLSGHVASMGQVTAVEPLGHGMRMTIRVPEEVQPYLFDKGYIGVDGASLTIAAVCRDEFDISLIPETLRLTTLDQCVVGTSVNIEIDSQTRSVVDTVERVLARTRQ